ncbi:MAG: AAA family ATPase [Treponema phagedenis]|uniref:ATP-binding protein n=1 Tax=Treponema phagedenis TaxID=162 RepID=UPI003133E3C3
MHSGQELLAKNSHVINELHAWAQELSKKYCSKTVNLYIVHGNIRDFLPHRDIAGGFAFVRIRDYISEVIFGNKDIIIFYDKSSGINFCLNSMLQEYLAIMHKKYPDVPIENLLSKDPVEAFSYLEQYFRMNMRQGKRIVLIVDYAESLTPAEDIAYLNETDRYCLVTLNRWSHDPVFTNEDISIVLLTENIADLNTRITASPSTVKIHIPLPDEAIRIDFLNDLKNREDLLILERGLNTEKLGKLTAGLNLVNLNQLAAETYQMSDDDGKIRGSTQSDPVTLEFLKQKKQEIIETEAAGMLQFVNTDHNLSYIAGNSFVKKRFVNAAKAIRQGRADVLPMGYLITGPIGTGKTFMVSAFAGEIGIPMVRLCNFHSMQQRTAEANLEKVLNILKAMAPVAVMVDEADAVFNAKRDSTGGESRIFAQISSFMGNTDYRGKIIWFLITSRPDLLPIDLKRQGRAEEHLAVFYPETAEEKIELLETLQRKLKIRLKDVNPAGIIKKLKFPVSGADLEAILVRSKLNAAMENRMMIVNADIEQTIEDFIPPSYPYEIELQNLVAVLECTSKEMIPKKYQNFDRSKLAAEILELKQLLGEK